MAIHGTTTVKSYFNTGDKPTEAQFGDFIDSIPYFGDEVVNVVRMGADPTGLTDSTTAFVSAIARASGGVLFIPKGTYVVNGFGPSLNTAGLRIIGASKWNTIISLGTAGSPGGAFSGASVFYRTAGANGTSFGFEISNLRVELNGNNATAVDFSAVNNSVVRNLRVVGGTGIANAVGTGVKFAAPSAAGSYTNVAEYNQLLNLSSAIVFASGANENHAMHNEIIGCSAGVLAVVSASAATPDHISVFGGRIEGCDIGIHDGARNSFFSNIRFEDSRTADVQFHAFAENEMHLGHSTSVTAGATAYANISSAHSVYILSPDGRFDVNESRGATRPLRWRGRSYFGREDVLVSAPPIALSESIWIHNGRLALNNNIWIEAMNAAQDAAVLMWQVSTNDLVATDAPVQFKSYTVAQLSAGTVSPANQQVWVSDEAGGAQPAYSDGTNWRRYSDGAVIS